MSNLRRNFSAGTYSTVVYLGCQLLLTPLLLWLWGKQTYANWLVLYTIPAYFAFAEAGINGSLGNALAIAVEQKDFEAASRMVRGVWHWQFLLWSAVFAVFLVMLAVFPVRSWLALGDLTPASFAMTAVLLAVYSLGTLQAGFYTAIFRAGGQFARFVRLSGSMRIVEVAGLAAAALAGGGLVAGAASLVALRIAFTLWCHAQRHRLLPEVDFRKGPAPWSEFVKLLPAGLGFLGFPIGNAVVNQGAIVLLNHLGGAPVVIMLNIGRQIGRLFLQGVTIIVQSVHPEMSVAFARGDFRRMAQLQAKTLTPILWCSPAFCLGLWAAGPWLVDLWTHHRIGLSHTVSGSFAIEACVASLSNAAILVVWATNRHLPLCATYLLAQGAALVGAWALYPICGLSAVPLAFSATTLMHAAVSLWMGARTARIKWIELIADAILGRAFLRIFAS
jgi:O-antigen/teichoic acid export membrane protein